MAKRLSRSRPAGSDSDNEEELVALVLTMAWLFANLIYHFTRWLI